MVVIIVANEGNMVGHEDSSIYLSNILKLQLVHLMSSFDFSVH